MDSRTAHIKRQINRVRWLIEKEINNLGIKMKNSIDMGERDVLITEVEILLWILYVIQSIEEEKSEVGRIGYMICLDMSRT